jgi:hypothetical protein
MSEKYSAKIYLGRDIIFQQSGEDIDELHAWMLARAEGVFGNIHGEIINNETLEVVRKFRKAPPD